MVDGTCALMYHAVGAHGAQADAHYTVDAERFAAQLELCRRVGGGLTSARAWLDGGDGVILTFDDGDASNYRVAFPALEAAGARADFFVYPAQVGEPRDATLAELREMADRGMSIQSHGLDHRHFLTALSGAQLREELTRARCGIEERVGRAVTLLAPVGGRTPADLAWIARECGYTHVL